MSDYGAISIWLSIQYKNLLVKSQIFVNQSMCPSWYRGLTTSYNYNFDYGQLGLIHPALVLFVCASLTQNKDFTYLTTKITGTYQGIQHQNGITHGFLPRFFNSASFSAAFSQPCSPPCSRCCCGATNLSVRSRTFAAVSWRQDSQWGSLGVCKSVT